MEYYLCQCTWNLVCVHLDWTIATFLTTPPIQTACFFVWAHRIQLCRLILGLLLWINMPIQTSHYGASGLLKVQWGEIIHHHHKHDMVCHRLSGRMCFWYCVQQHNTVRFRCVTELHVHGNCGCVWLKYVCLGSSLLILLDVRHPYHAYVCKLYRLLSIWIWNQRTLVSGNCCLFIGCRWSI